MVIWLVVVAAVVAEVAVLVVEVVASVEIGDISVVTRLAVDQEVVGSNSTNGENLLDLRIYSAHWVK